MTHREFKKQMRLVEIHWVDAASDSGWQGQKAPGDETVDCRTVGYLLKRDSRVITVAQNVSHHGSTGEWMTIPVSCVRRVRRLR
jgi:hypothetical protein